MPRDGEPLLTITDPDQDRYARLRLLADYHQETIANARIMVVGAGALGNEVLKNLALLGAGHVLVVDFDTVELSNLTRSILFRAEDCGRAKAEVAAERVRAINPDVRIIPLQADVTSEVGLGVFRQMDVVIGCLDSREARLAVNRACWRAGRPWVDGALNVGDGLVRVFIPPDGACYECLMTRQDYALAQMRYACPPATLRDGLALTTPMSASIIGAMQVQETVKLLHGHPVAAGRAVYYSAETLRTTPVAYPRRADCPVHEPVDRVIALPEGVDDLTVGGLLARAAAEVGEGTALVLPGDLVTAWYCPQCDVLEPVFRPYRTVVPLAAACPTCGTTRTYDVAGLLAANPSTVDLPLAQVGIPPYAVVTVRGRGQQIGLELSGDRARVLGGWE